MNFRIILTQFYINFSRQEHQIEVLYVCTTPEILRFNPIPPFIFPLQSLTKESLSIPSIVPFMIFQLSPAGITSDIEVGDDPFLYSNNFKIFYVPRKKYLLIPTLISKLKMILSCPLIILKYSRSLVRSIS